MNKETNISMSEQLEIEFKNMLTASEYQKLLLYFQAKEKSFFFQENHYYDTIHEDLKHLRCGLRIRIMPNSAELTLKTPLGDHLLETTDPLSLKTAKELISKNSILQTGAVAKKLQSLKVDPDSVQLIGSLKTKRFEKETKDGLFVLDHSFYGEQTDFELEFETHDADSGEQIFNRFLEVHHLMKRPSKNKIVRMLEAFSLNSPITD